MRAAGPPTRAGGSAVDRIEVRFELGSEAVAGEIIDQLAAEGGTVTKHPVKGIVPVIPLVVAGVIAAGGLAAVILYVRRSLGCRSIVDARGAAVTAKVDCSVRDGRIIVLSKDGEKVEVVEVPPAVDLAKVVEAAMKGGAGAVRKAAEAAGATVAAAG